MEKSFNPFSLENKTILITGASSGIGRQCAIDCSKMGLRLWPLAAIRNVLTRHCNRWKGKAIPPIHMISRRPTAPKIWLLR